tara:strand:+ start:717 stop:1622 length:906 start_codon:yes stop_codon:yes gene_type:complete
MNKKFNIKVIINSNYKFIVIAIILSLIILFSYLFTNENNQIEKINLDENDNSLNTDQEHNDTFEEIVKDKHIKKKDDIFAKQITKKEKDQISKQADVKKKELNASLKSNTDKKNIKKKEVIKEEDNKDIVNDPSSTVNELHSGLKKISDGNLNDYNKVLKLISLTYDTHKMTGMIVGNNWKKVTIQKQNELKKVFEEYIAKNYIKRFRKIGNIKFNEIETLKINKDFRMVKTILTVNDNENIKIDYLLMKKNKKWKIFDILLAGSVSEIATKKSEFSSFIRDSNIDNLTDALRKKNSTILK